MVATLVDAEVTRKKFREELALWKEHGDLAKRGWLVLNENLTELSIELALLARLATSAAVGFLPVVVCAIRLSYDNYDLWPPSLTFIDIFTRQPSHPHVRAFLSTPEGPRDVLIDGHPFTRQPFLCLPGIREYHTHPQHTGDDWLLHRSSKEGSLSTIGERVWRMMARNVIGLGVSVQALPVFPLRAQVAIQVAQGELEGMLGGAGMIAPPAVAAK
jgi:hypothetical protein